MAGKSGLRAYAGNSRPRTESGQGKRKLAETRQKRKMDTAAYVAQETRNKLTDYWKKSGVEKSDEFAFLTNIIHQEWTGLTVKKHKDLKGLKTQNLRDHMSEAELIFTALAELSTRQIAETEKAKGVQQNAIAGKKGGKIAKDAKLALEEKTGQKIVTSQNFLPPQTEKKKLNKKK